MMGQNVFNTSTLLLLYCVNIIKTNPKCYVNLPFCFKDTDHVKFSCPVDSVA